MTSDPKQPVVDKAALSVLRAKQALRLVCAEMPHLAGLAHLCRVRATPYFAVAAVGSSGLVAVNPDVFTRIPLADAAFVLAHELMHLALDSHGRQGAADPYLVNVAHDFIINDMLGEEIGRGVPLGGLVREGARNESLEALLVELTKRGKGGRIGVWKTGGARQRHRRPQPGKSPLSEALEKAGLVPKETSEPELPPLPAGKTPLGDLIPNPHEDIFEPGVGPQLRKKLREQVRKAAAKAMSLGALRAKLDEAQNGGPPPDPQRGELMMKAVHAAYQPPWQLALQRWMDAVAPAGRSYAKASRRGADRDDGVVLCGRLREGWTLHIVLDTSGSMENVLPKVLGAIASFCDGAGVAAVHILQCDVEVTRDEWLEPPQLAEYRIAGFGGSDMSPGLNKLAEDAEVNAVLVLTDGYISYPAIEPPYNVLWAIFRGPDGYESNFTPGYGEVVFLDP
jgi:predicted metal-dependent peptidase